MTVQLIDTSKIAKMLGLSTRHAREFLVHRTDFPRPPFNCQSRPVDGHWMMLKTGLKSNERNVRGNHAGIKHPAHYPLTRMNARNWSSFLGTILYSYSPFLGQFGDSTQ